MPSIVTVNVNQQVAPAPATLQQTGALISQGATVTTPLTASLLTQASDFTPLMVGAKAITSMVQSSGTVTVTTTAAHGFTSGDTLLLSIAGVVPTGYNGTFLATVTGASTFTYPLASSPGTVTTQGMYTPEDVAELLAMVTSFFSQGGNQAVYVLELGPGNATDGATALQAYITANPNNQYRPGPNGTFNGYFYSYVVPRTWDGNATFLALAASLSSTTSRTYFWTTTTLATYAAYPVTTKSIVPVIESPSMGIYPANAITAASTSGGIATVTTTTAHGVVPGNWFQVAGMTPTAYNGWALALPGTTATALVYAVAAGTASGTGFGTLLPSYYANSGIPSTEFSAAAMIYSALHYKPGATNKVAPYAFQYLYGVTPFPTRGLSALLTTLKNAAVNIVGTGAEGGISNAIILWGTTADGRGFTYWYSVDWIQITVDLRVANGVINGSNNPINPLYYNQDGINRLQAIAAGVCDQGLQFGLILWPSAQTQLNGPDLAAAIAAGTYTQRTVVNAIPFVPYSVANPGDYKLGQYSGFAITYTPQLGFTSITFNVLVSDFVVSQ